jgi:transcriptional regulator with XRE-family HTH domain
MGFGEKIRELRKAKNLSQRALGDLVGVSFTYISKVENEKLDFGDYPSEDLIRKLAKALEADEGDLFLLAEKIPEEIRKRVMERPDAFRKFASLDDEAIDKLLEELGDDP